MPVTDDSGVEIWKTQQAEFQRMWKRGDWSLAGTSARILLRRVRFVDGDAPVGEIEVEFVKNHRRMEWGALWAAAVSGFAQSGPLAGLLQEIPEKPAPQLFTRSLVMVDSRLDPRRLPPLRRDGTVTFVEDSDVGANFAVVQTYLREHVIPRLERFYLGDIGVVDDVLVRDGFGYQYPGSSIVAACVHAGDLELMERVTNTKRFKKLPDVRGAYRQDLLEWARSRGR